MRDAIAALDFTSFYGPIKWTEQGDGNAVLMGPKVGQVQNGVMEIVHPTAAATAKLVSPMTPWAARKG